MNEIERVVYLFVSLSYKSNLIE